MSNLANEITYGSTTINYTFDANGNQISEGSSRSFEWDYGDRLRGFAEGTSVRAAYLYDAGGQRVKKIVTKSAGNTEVTVYIDGGFEYLYELDSSGTKDEEFNEFHVMDDRSRIARVKVFGSTWSGSTADEVRYNLEDHLGNAGFTLDDAGSLITREEYFPFGETSFGSFAKKRYRFCGKERDEESGLYYYGARYYAAWTCRFVSIDPLADKFPFYTPFQYAGNQPVNSVDLDGLEPDPSTATSGQSAGGSQADDGQSEPKPSGQSSKEAKVSPKPANAPKSASRSPQAQNNPSAGNAASPHVYVGAYPHYDIPRVNGDIAIIRGDIFQYNQVSKVNGVWKPIGKLERQSQIELDQRIGQWIEQNVGGTSSEFGPRDDSPFTVAGKLVGETAYMLCPGAGIVDMAMGHSEVNVINVGFAALSFIPFGAEANGAKAVTKKVAGEAVEHADEIGKTTVYLSRNSDKIVHYVGITDDFARRFGEHLAKKGIEIKAFLTGLTRADARAVEQVLIEYYKLGKHGGTLLNKINSIARSNPKYADAIQRGIHILTKSGFKF